MQTLLTSKFTHVIDTSKDQKYHTDLNSLDRIISPKNLESLFRDILQKKYVTLQSSSFFYCNKELTFSFIRIINRIMDS